MASKREEKIAMIKRELPSCSTSWRVYVYGEIPQKLFRNACSVYVKNTDQNDVFGMIDETLFSNGKKGMTFTESGVYYNLDKGNGYVEYRQINPNVARRELGENVNRFLFVLNNCFGYNRKAIGNLLKELYAIETEPSGVEIAGGLLGGILGSVLQSVRSTVDSIEKHKEYYRRFDVEKLHRELEKLQGNDYRREERQAIIQVLKEKSHK